MSISPLIDALLRTRTALLLDVASNPRAGTPVSDDATERLLILANPRGTLQLFEHVDGDLREITRLPEAVSDAAYLPGAGPRRAVVSAAVGGNERDQLYLIDLDQAATAPVSDFTALHPLTADPDHAHHLAGISPDGRRVAYTSNRANGIDFDLWCMELDSGAHRLVWPSGGWAHPAGGFSPDGRLVAVIVDGSRPLDSDLVLVDIESGAAQYPLPHPDEAAEVGAPCWVDASRFYLSTNVDRDLMAILHHDLSSGSTEQVPGTGEDGDAEFVLRVNDGRLLVVENVDAASRVRLLDPATGTGEVLDFAETGVVVSYGLPGPRLSGDAQRLFYTLTTPRKPAAVYARSLATGETARLTEAPAELTQPLSPVELATIPSFDGEPIQLLIHRPPVRPEHPAPVVVLVHGGPEGQSQQAFNPVIQALAASGYGVVVPNVRGSVGYGKRFAALDDTTRRLDSVADLAAVHEALGALRFDPDRAALWGGSYGGYMVLAGVSMQPERWAAGVDIVGISDLVTFLENTSDYRRAHREREYGSLATDREFLIRASPMTHVEHIRAPLFIIHGRNDPRVPVGEAEQLAAHLRRGGIACELLIYDNEGHGLARLENRLDAYPRALAFLDRVLS